MKITPANCQEMTKYLGEFDTDSAIDLAKLWQEDHHMVAAVLATKPPEKALEVAELLVKWQGTDSLSHLARLIRACSGRS